MAAALLAGAAYRYRSQDAVSVEDWGDFTGVTLADMCRLFQPEEVIKGLILPTVERAFDTGEVQSYDLSSRGGVGRTTVLRTPEGLLTRWEWITEPLPRPEISADLRLRLVEEHLRLLAWSLREGRPLPSLPAALRGRRPVPS